LNGYTVYVSASAATSGPTGYANVKAAFDAIIAGTHQGTVTITIQSNTTEALTAVLNASGGTANYTSVYIYPTISGLSISGNFAAAPTIDLNGADNVTIDGSVNASGSTKNLNIINLNTSGLDFTSTIRFINDASGNTVKFCNLKGSSTGSTQAGTLLFSTAGSGTGNDNNTVEHNDITCTEDANRPQNSIHYMGSKSLQAQHPTPIILLVWEATQHPTSMVYRKTALRARPTTFTLTRCISEVCQLQA